jgi:hypothetical protein
VGRVEVVGVMNRDRRLLDDAGAHRTGSGARFAPVGAKVESGLLQFPRTGVVADEVHRDSVRVGQQQDVADAGHALVQLLHAGAGDAEEFFDMVLVFAQARMFDDVGPCRAARVEPVVADTAYPRTADSIGWARAGL